MPMTNDYFKYYKSKQLLLLIVYFTTLFLWVKSHWGWALSITTVLGFLFWAIDKSGSINRLIGSFGLTIFPEDMKVC
jgi:hypothetical protein